VIDTGRDEIDLSEFPAGTEIIAIVVENGDALRGVFVPAGPDAPIVAMFLESSGSITNGGTDMPGYPVAWDLRGAGIALLCVDYRGVGMSNGEPAPDNIARDALAVWGEAQRRAGNRGDRIVLRGMSMGTWAICPLLDMGAEPAAVVITAPVRAETIVRHVADNLDEGGFEAGLAKLVLKRRTAKSPYVEPRRLDAVLRTRPPLDNQSRRLGWIRRLDTELVNALPDDALSALISFEDPACALDASELCGWELWVGRRHASALPCDANTLLAALEESDRHNKAVLAHSRHDLRAIFFVFTADQLTGAGPRGMFPRLRLAERERLRQALLWALKMDMQPARGVTRDGKHEIEVWSEAHGWEIVPLD